MIKLADRHLSTEIPKNYALEFQNNFVTSQKSLLDVLCAKERNNGFVSI